MKNPRRYARRLEFIIFCLLCLIVYLIFHMVMIPRCEPVLALVTRAEQIAATDCRQIMTGEKMR